MPARRLFPNHQLRSNRRSRLGARLARPQSIVVFVEKEPRSESQGDPYLERLADRDHSIFNGLPKQSLDAFSSYSVLKSLPEQSNIQSILSEILPHRLF